MKNADREQTIAAMNEWMQEKDVAALYSSRERTEDELRIYELMDRALALLEAQENEIELLHDRMTEIRATVRPIIANAPRILEYATPPSEEG